MIVTWSESQRTGRDTCSITSGMNSSNDEILSATISVGWKCPVSRVTILPRLAP